MANRIRTTNHKTLHSKTKDWAKWTPPKTVVNSGAPDGKAVPVPIIEHELCSYQIKYFICTDLTVFLIAILCSTSNLNCFISMYTLKRKFDKF
jgi:hypothetical protein